MVCLFANESASGKHKHVLAFRAIEMLLVRNWRGECRTAQRHECRQTPNGIYIDVYEYYKHCRFANINVDRRSWATLKFTDDEGGGGARCMRRRTSAMPFQCFVCWEKKTNEKKNSESICAALDERADSWLWYFRLTIISCAKTEWFVILASDWLRSKIDSCKVSCVYPCARLKRIVRYRLTWCLAIMDTLVWMADTESVCWGSWFADWFDWNMRGMLVIPAIIYFVWENNEEFERGIFEFEWKWIGWTGEESRGNGASGGKLEDSLVMQKKHQ